MNSMCMSITGTVELVGVDMKTRMPVKSIYLAMVSK